MSSKRKSFPARLARHATGIRAQEARATVGKSWWAKRWLAAIEPMNIGARFGLARNYAISGQVTELAIDGPVVTAKVVGVREDAYSVKIVFRVPEAGARKRIVEALRAEPILAARLLAGDLPLEVEEIFRREELTLFPGGKIAERVYDVTTTCSCPDWANPCKHSLAVLLLLGEEIARRPLRLLELRGVTMEDISNEE